MDELVVGPLTGSVIGLQFVAFGWRVNREIAVGDQERRTWLPVPDCINVLALFWTIGLCVILPLSQGGRFAGLSRATLAAAAVLVAFHPVSMAAHYGLFTGQRPRKGGGDIQFAPRPEKVSTTVSVCLALLSALACA